MSGTAGRRSMAIALAGLLAGGGTALAQMHQAFGAATFLSPPGWSISSQPGMQVFSVVTGQDRCMIMLSAEHASPPGLAAAFSAAWQALFGTGFRRVGLPASVEQRSAMGSRYAVGEGPLEDAAGNRLVARLHVFPVGSSSQWVALIGNGAAALSACQDGWTIFFQSLRFPAEAAEATKPVEPAGSGAVEETNSDGPQRFDNISFVPPRGWSVRRLKGFVHLSAAGVRDPERLEVFLLSGHRGTDLAAEVGTAWEEVRTLVNAESMRNVSGRNFDLDQPALTLAGVEYLRGNGGMRMGGAEWDVTIFALRAGERIERVAVLAHAFTENLTRYSTATNPRYAKEIRQLVFRMTFANQPERSIAPAGLRSSGIEGVWAGLGMSFGRIKPELAVFFDNGLAYFGSSLPLEGLDGIDPVVEQTSHPRDWGTYTWTGDSGVLNLPWGVVPLRRTGAALELTPNRTLHRYTRLVMPASASLDGTWCYENASCLQLTSDGRFEDRGAIRSAEHSLYAWPQAPAGGQGKYALREHTLQLSYDGGAVVRVAFPGVEDGSTSSPSRLWLGWNFDLLARR